MKTAVVFYTRFGSTAKVAKALAAELGAEVRAIKAVRECGFLGMGFRSVFGIRMAIQPMSLDFSGVEQVVLCTPIWAGRPANPARTFLKEAKLDGKKLAVLFTTGGGPMEQALAAIKADLASKRVEVGPVGAIATRKKSDEELRAEARQFAQKLKG